MAVSKVAMFSLVGAAVSGFRVRDRRENTDVDIPEETWQELLEDMSEEVPENPEDYDKFDEDPWEDDDEFEPDMETRFGGGSDYDISQFDSCYLSKSACSIKDMTKATIVYTDSSDTKCWNGDGFGFLVHPGASNKLLYYFAGGGACWDQPNIFIPGSAKLCSDNFKKGIKAAGYGQGVMSFNNSKNPFREYTVVSPAYCSGGLHIANKTVKNAFGTGYQHDYNSHMRTIEWVQSNLGSSFSSMVLMGSSAGSLGAIMWADFFLSTFNYNKASVLLDSYVGVFPSGTPARLIPNYDACNLPILSPYRSQCNAGKFELDDVLTHTIGKHRNVAFGHIQAKVDLIQRIFYSAVALSFFKLDFFLTRGRFFKKGNSIMQTCSKFPNYAAYIVRNGNHVFADSDVFYSASFKGKSKSGSPPMTEWVGKFIDHQRVRTECDGKHKGNGWIWGNYCDKKLMGKSLSL